MDLNTIASWASIIGLVISLISLFLVKNIYTQTKNTNIKSGNRQSSTGVGNTQSMDIK